MTDRGYATPQGGRHGPARPGPVSVPRHRVAVRAAAFRKDGRQALCGRLFSRLEASRSHGDRGLYQLSSNNSIALKHGCLPPPLTPGGPPLRLGPAAPGLALRHLRFPRPPDHFAFCLPRKWPQAALPGTARHGHGHRLALGTVSYHTAM